MPEQNRPVRSPRRFLQVGVLALCAGIVAGVAGIYVNHAGSGNEAAAACPADDRLKQALLAAATGEVAAVAPLDQPFDVSSVAFEDGNAKPMTLRDFAGKTLLVNLWATWCVPCRQEMPALDALEAREGGADFGVIPINVDLGVADKPKAFYAEANLRSLPFFRDQTMAVFNDLKSQGVTIGLPVSLLVDEAGCARAVLTGPAEWASPDAARLIAAMRSDAV
ncbi:sodium:dicarboxylate symporter [Aureimonas sp. SA4125]|uniref:thiol:disulfide interchange protein TlpA n=1 Tax=Aureimonas sp. SA4125 TaxID=2826993 RepID=UPI001CC7359D|nr:TlpA disulfide reductase family protein [Aureimonas sp. SA4125]BDA86147.1 sodium:dicarboxylate symporter [Aureimonas sp. SA4125]